MYPGTQQDSQKNYIEIEKRKYLDLDKMGHVSILLDKMWLDEIGLDKIGWHRYHVQ